MGRHAQFLARGASHCIQSLAGCIINTFEFEFSVSVLNATGVSSLTGLKIALEADLGLSA
jgi:hypothetical protein